jgi:hypothetical protein
MLILFCVEHGPAKLPAGNLFLTGISHFCVKPGNKSAIFVKRRIIPYNVEKIVQIIGKGDGQDEIENQ